MDRPWTRAAVILALMAIGCGLVTAQEPPAAPSSGLEVKIDVEFDKVEFVDVIAALNERYGNHVQVDSGRLAEAGISLTLPIDRIVEDLQRTHHLPDAQLESLRNVLQSGAVHPITFAASGMTLRSAVRHIIAQVSDKFALQEVAGAALITTREAAREALVTRVYDVRGILPPPRTEEPSQWADASELEPTVEHRDPSELALRDLIVSTIAPETWDDVGGPASADYRDGVLVVLQTNHVQRQVAGLVEALKELRSPADADADPPTSIPIPDWPAGLSVEQRIRQALAGSTDVERTDVTLTELAAALQEEFGFPVLLADKARRLSRRQPSVLVSLAGEGRPLHVALHLALAPLGLAAIVEDEALVLTADDAPRRRRLVVYPVADLATDRGEGGGTRRLEELAEQITSTIAPASWNVLGGSGSIVAYEAVPVLAVWQIDEGHRRLEETLINLREIRGARPREAVPQEEPEAAAGEQPFVLVVFRLWQPWHAGAQVTEERLAEEIKSLVEPDTWEADETFIRVLPSRLIIRQRPEVHRRIYRLLRDLGVLRPQEQDEAIGHDRNPFGGGFGAGGLGGSFGAGGFGALPSGGP